MKYVIPLFVFGILLVPVVASAQDGLVTCEGPDCDWNALIEMINRIVAWLVMFLSIIAVIVMVIAGFRMVTSGGDVAAWTAAKQMFTNVVIGLIIVLAAWLIVDTLLATLTGGGLNKWLNPDVAVQDTVNGNNSDTGDTSAIGDEVAIRNQLDDMGYEINKASCNGMRYQDVPGGCTSVAGFSDGMLDSLSRLSSACNGCTLVITGGSEAGHQTHDDGNSVDLRFGTGIDAFMNNGGASSVGLNCVPEYGNQPHWHCRR